MHQVSEGFLRGRTKVQLVGAGGTGSALFVKLVNLHHTLLAFGHPGLHVTVYDADTVSESNLVRSSFFPTDVGLNKAAVLVNRVNLSYGLEWQAVPEKVETLERGADLLLCCVDNRAARAQLAEALATGRHSFYYVADCGNLDRAGQVVLGQPGAYHVRGGQIRLPTAYDLFPALTDTTLPDDDAPSCGTVEALEKQDLYVNDTLAVTLANLLWRLYRDGCLSYHGAFVNLQSGGVTPLPVDPVYWKKVRRRNRAALKKAASYV